jgi:peptidoglycan/xylan/chitin deacetylase (PgdA/CDA1 family)
LIRSDLTAPLDPTGNGQNLFIEPEIEPTTNGWEVPQGESDMADQDKFGQGKSVVLTFDDGPGDPKKPQLSALNSILKTLLENGIKAEFYLLGEEVEKFPDATKLIDSRGHTLQNHSWDHPNLATASKQEVQSQLEKTQDIIKKTTKVTPTKVRPPYGEGGWPRNIDKELAEVAKNLSLTIENWDIDTRDWAPPKGINEQKLKKIEDQFKGQSAKKRLVVLMHVQDETAKDLPGFISKLKSWGFGFAKP